MFEGPAFNRPVRGNPGRRSRNDEVQDAPRHVDDLANRLVREEGRHPGVGPGELEMLVRTNAIAMLDLDPADLAPPDQAPADLAPPDPTRLGALR